MMKQNTKIAFSAIMSALAVCFMMLSYFPYLTYAIPAFSGMFIMVAVIETDKKWATLSYIASAFLIFLFAETESKFMYIFLLGYYPILKAIFDSFKKPVLEWILKMLTFNVSVLIVYFILSNLLGFNLDDFGSFGKWGAIGFLAAGNVVFVIYDMAISKMAQAYLAIIHPKIKKFIK